MAKKKTTQKDGMSTAQKVGIGIGLTTAAVAAASTYFLYGSKQATQNRKKVKGWALKAKGDVLEALENAKEITEDEYKAAVDSAVGAYGTLKHATAGEVKDFKKEMIEHWNKLQKSNVVKKIGGAPARKKATPASATKKSSAGPKKSTKKK